MIIRIACTMLLLAFSAAAQNGFVSLFDGKDLKGWSGDPRLWKVENGVIVGSTDGVEPLKHNTFLIYKGERFTDFELHAQIKLRNHNSGIQFRSEEFPEWVVKGLQADAAEGNWWGSIYDEGGKRGVIVNGWKGKGENAVKPDDWNDYTIYCKGGEIRLTLNGVTTSELSGETPKDGVIALQLHAGKPMRVEFRNLRIKKLD